MWVSGTQLEPGDAIRCQGNAEGTGGRGRQGAEKHQMAKPKGLRAEHQDVPGSCHNNTAALSPLYTQALPLTVQTENRVLRQEDRRGTQKLLPIKITTFSRALTISESLFQMPWVLSLNLHNNPLRQVPY